MLKESTVSTRYRVLKIQIAGDYREAYERLAHGGVETYYAQHYSIESDALLGSQIEQMGVLCCKTDDVYDVVLPNGVRAMGAGLASYGTGKAVLPIIETFAPTHLIVAAPVAVWIRWALNNEIKVLPFLASSFSPSFGSIPPLRRLVKRWRHRRWTAELIRLLNNPKIPWIANHNMSSSRAINRLGVPAEKIIPWDWPAVVRPDHYSAKEHSGTDRMWRLTYVGVVSEEKGAGDLLDAVNLLVADGRKVQLDVIGPGNASAMSALANRVKHLVGDKIIFRGRIPHDLAVAAIREADVMIVPSRHDYPEGLPCTIFETLAVRTPLVCSDHPMFVENVKDGVSALVFRERNARELAACVSRLMDDSELYNRISAEGHAAWETLQVPTKYRELTHRWVRSTADDNKWLLDRTLARYAPSNVNCH